MRCAALSHKTDFTAHDRHGYPPQRIAATRASDANAFVQFEAGAMCGANQQAVFRQQKLAGRPIETTAGMRTDVQPGADTVPVAMQDHRFGDTIDLGFDLQLTAVGQIVQHRKSPGGRGRSA